MNHRCIVSRHAAAPSRAASDLLHAVAGTWAARFDRLLGVVESRRLCRSDEDAAVWLIDWMNAPRADLDGRSPMVFAGHPDWDLIVVGILLKEVPASAPSA